MNAEKIKSALKHMHALERSSERPNGLTRDNAYLEACSLPTQGRAIWPPLGCKVPPERSLRILERSMNMKHYLPPSALDDARKYRIEYIVSGQVFGSRDFGGTIDTLYHSHRVASRIADRCKQVCTVYVYRYSQPGVCLAAGGNVYAFHAEPLS